jgi:hypothetical protein
MELNITKFYNETAPMDYSASIAEIGNNAGADTWGAACEDSPDYMILDTGEKREAMREHVRGFGAWSDEEINAWSDIELNALLLQMIAGDIRESVLDDYPNAWAEYYQQCEQGIASGNLFADDDEQVYYRIGE